MMLLMMLKGANAFVKNHHGGYDRGTMSRFFDVAVNNLQQQQQQSSSPSSATSSSISSLSALKTGKFKTMPTVYTGATHFKRALRSLSTIKVDSAIANIRNRHRKHTAQSLDALMKAANSPLTSTLDFYQALFKTLHPYEAAVLDLTVAARVKLGHPDLQTILSTLKRLRASTSTTAKSFASLSRICVSAGEAKQLLLDGVDAVKKLYDTSVTATTTTTTTATTKELLPNESSDVMGKQDVQALDDLIDLQKVLRMLPVMELHLPTMVLIGAPNIGKSSIVRAVSTGHPEVNDYPFTTRGVTIGHIMQPHQFLPEGFLVDDLNQGIDDLRFQVMDTPGLLDRPEHLRNEMERLTFASLAHLPTAVIYVIDATSLSGEKSTLQAQLNIRAYLKTRFPTRPWIDVVSKGDIALSEETQRLLPTGHMVVSVKSGMNIALLREKIVITLFDLRKYLLEQ